MAPEWPETGASFGRQDGHGLYRRLVWRVRRPRIRWATIYCSPNCSAAGRQTTVSASPQCSTSATHRSSAITMPINVVLITFDALGYELLEQNIDRLPNLKLFRDQSVSFQNAFSVGPSTFFSFPAIIGSGYPFHLGVGIHDGVTTIDHLLQRQGYHT